MARVAQGRLSHVRLEMTDNFKNLKVYEDSRCLTVELNRPDKHNAFHPEMIAELTVAFTEAQKNPNLRMVLLKGNGSSFCAGGDLEWMKSMAGFSEKENFEDAGKLFDMFDAARKLPMPLVSYVHGNVMGGGLGFLGVSDFVIANEATKFCFTEVKWGLAPAVINPFILNKSNHPKLKWWMATAELFNVAQAHEVHLVEDVCTSATALKKIDHVRAQLLAVSKDGVRETKRLMNFVNDKHWSEFRKECSEAIARRRVSAAGQKGLKAFLEKQNPHWSEEP